MGRIVTLLAVALCITGCRGTWDNLNARWNNDTQTDNAYVGGRGIVTSEGPAGLFLNPTSGTQKKGVLTAQTCLATFEGSDGSSFSGNKVLVSYGVEDWLEVGAVSLDIQNDGLNPGIGPHVRARVVKEKSDSVVPEVAVGYYANEGRERVGREQKRVLFLAASKDIPLPWSDKAKPFVRSARLHAGVRHAWRDAPESTIGAGNRSDVVGWFGGEIEMPHNIFFVAEFATDEITLPRSPFGFGIQVRHPSGLGLTLGGIQPGFSADIGLYVGIGIGVSW